MLNHLSLKRLFDILLASFLIILTAPLMAVIALLIHLELRCHPIFIQTRAVTLNRKHFNIYKFRTLSCSSSDINDLIINSSSGYSIRQSVLHDIFRKPELSAYVSRTGAILRKTGLDELPQLFNILKGEMSFVGPRPLSIPDLETMLVLYPEYYRKRQKINSLPGLTGIWQIKGKRDKGIKDLVRMDIQYETIKSPSVDLRIILSTISLVFRLSVTDAILPYRKENRDLISKNLIRKQYYER